MNRSLACAAVALSLLAAATARALTSKAEEQRNAFRTAAEAQRKKLGLNDRVKLYAQYPTPEIGYASGRALQLAPGESGSIELKGSFPKGGAIFLNNDAVALTKSGATAGGWSGSFAVPKDALPADITLAVLAPISTAEADLRVVQIRGRYDLEAKVGDDGTRAVLHAKDLDDKKETATIEWHDKGVSAVSRTGPAVIEFDNDSVQVELMPPPEEQNAAIERAKTSVAALQDPQIVKELQAVNDKMMACTKVPQPQLNDCIKATSAQSEALQKKIQARNDDAQAKYEASRPHGSFTCLQWSLTGTASALTGEARCPDETRLKLTATAKYLGK